MFRRPSPLSESHLVSDFDCGKSPLNDFLILTAISNQRAGYSRTFVIADAEFRVAGYYSLCASMITRQAAPRDIGGHGSPKEIPVVLLARLAVDSRYHGQGLGALLLKNALASAATASENVGIRALMVHAIDDQAAHFYRRYGFRSVKDDNRTLFLKRDELDISLLALTSSE